MRGEPRLESAVGGALGATAPRAPGERGLGALLNDREASGGLVEREPLGGAERAHTPRGERSEAERADLGAVERAQFQTAGAAHAADLSFSPLLEIDAHDRAGRARAADRGGAGARGRAPVAEVDAADERGEAGFEIEPARGDAQQVALGEVDVGVEELAGEVAVVGQEQGAGGVAIEAPDGEGRRSPRARRARGRPRGGRPGRSAS